MKMKMMRKPKIYYDPKGRSGNLNILLQNIRNEFKKMHRITEYNDIWDRVQNAATYDEAVKIIGEKVELICLSKKPKNVEKR